MIPHSDHSHRSTSSTRDWVGLYFPNPELIALPGIVPVSNGPFGRSRLAASAELLALHKDATRHPDQYVRLFEAFAVAHDPQPNVVLLEGLPAPLGETVPNVLAVGRSDSGKSQKVSFPAVYHALRANWLIVYVNVKGRWHTDILRRLAQMAGRQDEVRLLAPRRPDRTLGWTALEGCHDLSPAGDIAACLVAGVAHHSRHGEGAWAYNQAQEWIQHAIAAICCELPAERQTLHELRQVALAGDYQALADAHPSDPALRKFARYVASENRNAETVAATIGEATAFVDDIQRCSP